MKIFIFLVVFFSYFSFAENYRSDCGKNNGVHASRVKSIIALLPRPPGLVFYMRVNSQYVILMSPEDVVDYLTSWVNDYEIREDIQLLEKIKSDLPLKDNVDIFKYSIANSHLSSRAEFVVSGLLGRGKASVINFWVSDPLGAALNEIVKVNIENKGTTIEFCLRSNESIFRVVESIDD